MSLKKKDYISARKLVTRMVRISQTKSTSTQESGFVRARKTMSARVAEGLKDFNTAGQL